MPAEPDSPELSWRPLALLLGVAVLLRVVTLVAYADLPFFEHHRLDAGMYDEGAHAMLEGALPEAGAPFHLSPAYTAMLAGVYGVLGDGPLAFRIVHALLGLGTIACIYFAAGRLGGRRAAVVAAGIAVFYGPALHYERFICVAPFAAFLHAALFLALLRCADREAGLGRWAFAGLVFGLAVIARPNAGLVVPAFLLPWFVRYPIGEASWFERLRAAGLAALCAAAMVLPVTAMNLRSTGEFIPVSSTGGLNYFIGNGEGANGLFRAPGEIPDAVNVSAQLEAFRGVAEREAGRELKWKEVDAYWWQRTREDIAQEPGTWLRLMAKKLGLFWNGYEAPNTHDFGFQRRITPSLYLAPLSFWALGALCLAAMFEGAWARRRELVMPGLYVLLYMSSIIAFFVLGHYRHPMFAIPCVLVGVWLPAVWEERKQLVATLLIALCLLVASREVKTASQAAEYKKLGYAYQIAGRMAEAEDAYLEALAIEEDYLEALNNLAVLYSDSGRIDAARDAWARVAMAARRQGRPEYEQRAAAYLATLSQSPPG